MTDEQIVKALECCIKSDHFGECFANKCPMISEEGCKVWNDDHKLLNMLYDLIKRQQEEIEALKKAGNKIDSLGLVATLMDQKERLVRAKNEWEREVRAEAVREFAEKLTNIICEKIEKSMSNPNGNDYFITDVYTDIDNLVREMTEKEGGKG